MKLRLHLGIGFANAEHEGVIEISPEELEGLTSVQKEALCDQYLDDWVDHYLDKNWTIVADDEEVDG